MKTFTEYQKLQEISALDVGKSSIGGTNLSNNEEGEMSSLFKAVRLSWDRYRNETLAFLQKMAHKDPDVQEELNKIKDTGISRLSAATRKIRPEPDVIGRQPSGDNSEDFDLDQ